jgi:hypothetical protein
MKPVRANFARPRVVSRWWWAAIALVFAVAGVLAWDWASSLRSAASLRTELAAQEESAKAVRDASMSVPPPSPPKPYDLHAREMLRQHDTPWPQLLDAIEAVHLPGVRVVNVDYTTAEAQARVEIMMVQQALALEYTAALNNGLPATGLAWRWSVLRIEQSRAEGSGRAALLARWAGQ